MKKKLIIFSGGLDSTAVALLANDNDSDITLLSFDYGQKAKKEIEVAKSFATKHNFKFLTKDVSALKFIFGDNQLTNESTTIEQNYKQSVVVPLRNALFLQIAMIYAYTNGFDEVWIGSHLDDCKLINDERFFPDCSPEFLKTFQLAMDLGTFIRDKKVKIMSPSIKGVNKSMLISMATKIDPKSIYSSWSCYKSGEKQCGMCDSCKNRKKAFVEACVEDKTEYEQ